MNIYEDVSANDVDRLIREYPLAWIVAGNDAHPIPLVSEHGGPPLRRLIGHIPKASQLARQLREKKEASLLFQGPQGYLSPSWLSSRDWAPTWCSATVRVTADIALVPEATADALRHIVSTMERGRVRPWAVSEMGARFESLAERVVAIHCEVKSIQPRFRLGQGETDAVFDELLQSLDDSQLAAWMRHMRPSRR